MFSTQRERDLYPDYENCMVVAVRPRVGMNTIPSHQGLLTDVGSSRLLATLISSLGLVRRRGTLLLLPLAQQFQVSRALAQHGLGPGRQASRVFLVDLGLLQQLRFPGGHGARPFLGDAGRG